MCDFTVLLFSMDNILRYTVKNNRNFKGPFIRVINSRKVGGTVNLRESARTFYIITVNLQFFCGFSVNHGQLTVILRDLAGKFAAGKCPVFSNHGAFPGSKFSG